MMTQNIFFSKTFWAKNFFKIYKSIAKHTDISTELLLNASGHALLHTFRKNISNLTISNESGKNKNSDKSGKSGQVGTL